MPAEDHSGVRRRIEEGVIRGTVTANLRVTLRYAATDEDGIRHGTADIRRRGGFGRTPILLEDLSDITVVPEDEGE
jgi:hypothetical protein